jgi:hypothetical protein
MLKGDNNMSNLDIQSAQKRLAEAERLINIAKKTREDAITKKTESLTMLSVSKNDLLNLGVTPENAEAELANLQAEILKELESIENNIPVDLLRELKRI